MSSTISVQRALGATEILGQYLQTGFNNLFLNIIDDLKLNFADKMKTEAIISYIDNSSFGTDYSIAVNLTNSEKIGANTSSLLRIDIKHIETGEIILLEYDYRPGSTILVSLGFKHTPYRLHEWIRFVKQSTVINWRVDPDFSDRIVLLKK